MTTHVPFFRPLRNAIFKCKYFVQRIWYNIRPLIHLVVLLCIYWYLYKFARFVLQFLIKLVRGKSVQARSYFCPLRNRHTSGEKCIIFWLVFYVNLVRTRNKWLLSTSKNPSLFHCLMIFLWPLITNVPSVTKCPLRNAPTKTEFTYHPVNFSDNQA